MWRRPPAPSPSLPEGSLSRLEPRVSVCLCRGREALSWEGGLRRSCSHPAPPPSRLSSLSLLPSEGTGWRFSWQEIGGHKGSRLCGWAQRGRVG